MRIHCEDAVGDGGVVVDIQVQAAPEALRKADRRAAALRDAEGACTLALGAEDLADEDAADGRKCAVVAGKQKPELERHAQDPLPDRHLWEHAIDEVRGRPAHAPGIAGGANPAALAREGDEQLARALTATGAQEAVRVNAAAKVGAKLGLHVARQPSLVLLARRGEEGFEVRGDELVEQRLHGSALGVGFRLAPCGDGVHGESTAGSVPRPLVVDSRQVRGRERPGGHVASGGRSAQRSEAKTTLPPYPRSSAWSAATARPASCDGTGYSHQCSRRVTTPGLALAWARPATIVTKRQIANVLCLLFVSASTAPGVDLWVTTRQQPRAPRLDPRPPIHQIPSRLQ